MLVNFHIYHPPLYYIIRKREVFSFTFTKTYGIFT
nr:MAG TPA: hypothetical protein [Caudoviricetes sp.]